MNPPNNRFWSKEQVERLGEVAEADKARARELLGTERLDYELGGLLLQRLTDLGDMIDLVMWLQHEANALRQQMGMNVAQAFAAQGQMAELQAKVAGLEAENEELRERAASGGIH